MGSDDRAHQQRVGSRHGQHLLEVGEAAAQIDVAFGGAGGEGRFRWIRYAHELEAGELCHMALPDAAGAHSSAAHRDPQAALGAVATSPSSHLLKSAHEVGLRLPPQHLADPLDRGRERD